MFNLDMFNFDIDYEDNKSLIICFFFSSNLGLLGTQAIRKERESQAHASSDIKMKADRDGFGSSWRDFPSATKILFRNPTFVLLTLGIAADNIFATGAEVFLPIYLENQFGLSSGNANIIVGKILQSVLKLKFLDFSVHGICITNIIINSLL